MVIQGERKEIMCLKWIRDLKCDFLISLGTRQRWVFWIVLKSGWFLANSSPRMLSTNQPQLKSGRSCIVSSVSFYVLFSLPFVKTHIWYLVHDRCTLSICKRRDVRMNAWTSEWMIACIWEGQITNNLGDTIRKKRKIKKDSGPEWSPTHHAVGGNARALGFWSAGRRLGVCEKTLLFPEPPGFLALCCFNTAADLGRSLQRVLPNPSLSSSAARESVGHYQGFLHFLPISLCPVLILPHPVAATWWQQEGAPGPSASG